MLVLSRKRAESIQFGDSVIVTVFEIRGNRVRLGIVAPVELPVLRTQLHEELLAGCDRQSLAAPSELA